MMADSRRNARVERAVHQALERVDSFISGARVTLPTAVHRRAIEALLDSRSPSVKTAALFLSFYWLEDPDWDLDTVPIGVRGQHGDKLLSEQLTRRAITLHGAITAYDENLGWKGNVRSVRLSNDPRFQGFLAAIRDASPAERRRIADFFAQRFAETKVESSPLPPVGPNVMTFVRAKMLFAKLLDIPSEGHIQQFIIAALLFELRKGQGIDVLTHHPHAADRYDDTAGDIVEIQHDKVMRAYEVTVRQDWENRISNFRTKMDRFGLPKYIIVASGVNVSRTWSVPAEMALRLEAYGRDITVVDIRDVTNFLAAELSAAQLRSAVNKAYDYLGDPSLCGREDLKLEYRKAVRDWLDSVP